MVLIEEETMSPVKPIPDGYHSLQCYLYVRGAAEALEFYRKAFGATERMRMNGPDGKVVHAELQFGDSVVMLADEAPERGIRSPQDLGGVSSSLMLYVEDCDAVYRQALASGAKSLREPADQFYGDRSAGLIDPFGFQWWIGTHIRDVSMEEMQSAMEGAQA
jgi:PhnB protein